MAWPFVPGLRVAERAVAELSVPGRGSRGVGGRRETDIARPFLGAGPLPGSWSRATNGSTAGSGRRGAGWLDGRSPDAGRGLASGPVESSRATRRT
jgi:hypothetical protein